MEFLKAILGDELYSQFESKINEYNGSEANKDKQVKIGNISTGEYVNKSDYDALNETLKGKETELATANTLIADLKKSTNGNEDLQAKLNEKGEKLELDENGNIKGWEDKLSGLKTQFPNMFESGENKGGFKVLGDNRLPGGGEKGSFIC